MRLGEAVAGCSWMAIAASVLSASPSGDEARAPRGGVFRSGVEIVALNVTVTDAAKRFVAGLTQRDFAVFEDGSPRPVALFAGGDAPLDVAVLLDTSASISGQMDRIRASAVAFLQALRASDRGTVIGFNNRIVVLQEWTSDRALLESAVRRVEPGGGTSLFTALYIALKSFGESHAGGHLRRQAVLVLSDGDDTTSLISYDDVLDVCRRVGVSVYTIRISDTDRLPIPSTVRLDVGVSGEFAMSSFARETGARFFTLRGLERLEATYRSIADELSHQYVLGYVPGPERTDRKYRHLQVTVSGPPGARARTRAGYIYQPTGYATLP